MARRPGNLDLSGANNAPGPFLVSPRNHMHIDLPSPRVGEVPPALSPLDMIAQQSRMLAKRFDESQQKGRRISRLDHLEIANELGRRPTYFRSVSGRSESAQESSGDEGQRPVIEDQSKYSPSNTTRPVSHYPRFSNTTTEEKAHRTRQNVQASDARSVPRGNRVANEENYFGIQVPRASSPEAYDGRRPYKADASPALPSLTGSVDSVTSSQVRTNTDDSIASRRYEGGLLSPKSSRPPRLNKSGVSIRSVIDSTDEDASSLAAYHPNDLLPPRKFSNSSTVSRPRSPLTPDTFPASQSPSAGSDHSMAGGGHFQRPSFNFSRPLSSASNRVVPDGRPSLSSRPSYESRPSFEFPPRQSSIDHSRSPLRQTSDSPSIDREKTTPTLQRPDAPVSYTHLTLPTIYSV